MDCGETDPVVLEFDHIRDKRGDVTQMISGGLLWDTVEAEIAKCEVRCVNCHVRKSAKSIGIYDRKHSFAQIQEAIVQYSVAIAGLGRQ